MPSWKDLRVLVDAQEFIAGVYEDAKGQRCVLGEMAARGGYPAGQLVDVIDSIGNLPDLAAAACRWSGLRLEELLFLQGVNDGARTGASRRVALLDALDRIREGRLANV